MEEVLGFHPGILFTLRSDSAAIAPSPELACWYTHAPSHSGFGLDMLPPGGNYMSLLSDLQLGSQFSWELFNPDFTDLNYHCPYLTM
jgi:hypothetical protein